MADIPSRLRLAAAASLILLPVAAQALQGDATRTDIAELSIEELANIQITSVSRKPERLADAAASVFVITAEDIRRAGAANLPEALRLAPNLQVAQVDAYSYAITARGLNGSNNSSPNKLLVLIDGRSVYTPLFSGVFWDAQELMLEDVERIEVISGPGGTLWGVNAVNGVINIITRPAQDTAGSLAVLRAGTRGREGAFRQGGASEGVAWRVYGKYGERKHSALADGGFVNDAQHQAQLGMRADWQRGDDRYTASASAYQGRGQQPEPGSISVEGTSLELGPIDSSGANAIAGWTHALDGGASMSLHGYWDHTKRTVPPAFAESLDIADLLLQFQLAPVGTHSLVVGANYRHTWDRVTNSSIIAFLPAHQQQTFASLFGQDDVALSDRTRLTLGARFERNDYTGTEFLPTVRLAWSATSRHAFWGGLSRTVRAPSRLDADAFVPGAPPYLLRGGPVVRSEVANVFELGYRGQPLAGLSTSLTLFHNDYQHLRTQEIDPSNTYITFDNKMRGSATGLEFWASAQLRPWWRMSAGGVLLHQTFRLTDDSNDEAGPGTAGKDPAHTLQLRSNFTLAEGKELELALRKVAALENPQVPRYVALDARFGWQLSRRWELSLIGQNLNGGHGEYGPLGTRTEVPRALAVKLVWQ
jgi:iron complex outermembrane receptor protein